MTGKQIRKYIENELGCDPVHEVDALAVAAERTANLFEDVEPKRVIEFMLDDKPINSLMTHSYGFHTANGRGIINSLKGKYYEYN